MSIYKKTKDYDKFKFFGFNRPLNEGLVKRLMDSISQIGYMDGSVITVDKDYAILDGQHRFTACMRLGLDINYVISNVNAYDAIIKLNANQVHWTTKDYVHAWAEKGIKCYKYIENFDREHKLGISNSLLICSTDIAGGTDLRAIKKGTPFPINPNSQGILDFMKACEAVPYWKSSTFVKALVRLFKVSNDKQRAKIIVNIISIPQQATPNDYLSVFENIANRKMKKSNHVSFRQIV